MSIHYCNQCKQAFLPEATKTDGDYLFCKKCNVQLTNLGSESGQVSLRAHIESQHGNTTPNVQQFALIKSKHFQVPKHDPILIECEELLSQNPLNTAALFTLCKWYYSKGRIEESVAIANQIISIDPNFSDASEFISQQSQYITQASQKLPNDIKPLETMAINYLKKENYSEAIPTFKKILTLDPKHAAAHRYLAEIYCAINKHELAIHHFNYLTLIYPNDYRVYYNFAVLCYQINDIQRALSNLNQAYKICNDDPDFSAMIKEMIDHIQSKS